jgi:purine nucleosidase
MRKVLIDTDPGTDDALALMMALNAPDLDVVGIATVGGNASLAHTTRNALRVLEYLGVHDIPVSRGSARPLKGRFSYAYHFHGPGGMTGRMPIPTSRPHQAGATDLIVRMAARHRGRLSIIALGPLTNVARALLQEPRIVEWTREIVVMGGAVEAAGNVTPSAEFNFYNDPLAAQMVLTSGIPVTLVGLDVCSKTVPTRDGRPWAPSSSRTALLTDRLLASWFRTHPQGDSFQLCDPLAVAAAVTPDVLTLRRASVNVELQETEHLGKTSARYGRGPVSVALDVDVDRATETIWGLLGRGP